jgi:GAF domain-containing protein
MRGWLFDMMNDTHRQALDALTAAIGDETDAQRAMETTVRLLARHLPDYTWTGIYLLDGNELHLGPFVGKPSPHTRIPLGRGICGAAATEKATIIVDDVNADPRYLACSIETRSEIVVPIMLDGDVLGELDIDSDRTAAFGASDREMLERVAALLAPKLARTRQAS